MPPAPWSSMAMDGCWRTRAGPCPCRYPQPRGSRAVADRDTRLPAGRGERNPAATGYRRRADRFCRAGHPAIQRAGLEPRDRPGAVARAQLAGHAHRRGSRGTGPTRGRDPGTQRTAAVAALRRRQAALAAAERGGRDRRARARHTRHRPAGKLSTAPSDRVERRGGRPCQCLAYPVVESGNP